MRSSFEQLAASIASIAGLGLIAALLMLGSWLIAQWLGRGARKAIENLQQEGGEPRGTAMAFDTHSQNKEPPRPLASPSK